ncbi:MAG: hypothetical protein KZQ66_07370, partial [Candidatus Thiodiazotropha sp. (ex Lucinoma aequizonata)]|nr:hypothetical protein [Candidatus Thiodiazotropha sp. (ex Lucinoma aequizonata)]MCU7896373.1 hypothetical protein [Candidatus Thiodiazotropha sp. (ex Lucinoma aequizonata)]MCU7898183.1 hypothetical protein [Candidatus Thiodiazotropha sp. (ex Lucinoma aequizonata)]MCU7901830.1 hypothetical protein [Candidatus Thiodiazotropha sp. (ex Lucinoma aequizonata)]MCU7908718.1 hypothetical protein [Candidatus Thiodiazotropha sp. (ex Lucinoma aequizonata)]
MASFICFAASLSLIASAIASSCSKVMPGLSKVSGNYSAKKLEKVLDKVFLYFFRFQRRLPTY